MLLQGQIALMTGASRGIGQAIAPELGRQGARGIGTATSSDGAEKISHVLKQENVAGKGVVLDVNNTDSITAALSELEKSGATPTILVNNAGITRDNLLLRMTEEEWDAILDTNLKSVYRMTKAGLIGFTKALAREVGSRNITVNAVAPGFIDTDMTRALPDAQKEALLKQIPLGRLGRAEEIAQAVAFLASPQAGYITGTTLHVNGGMYMN